MNPTIRKNLWILEFVAVALIAYLLAKMTINLVMSRFNTATQKAPVVQTTGAIPLPEPVMIDATRIVSRNIFDAENLASSSGAPSSENEEKSGAPTDVIKTGEPVLTTLDLQLLSTFSIGDGADPRSNAAVVTKDSGSDGKIFSIGQELISGTKVTRILADRLIFTHDGRLEYVLLNDFAKGGGGDSKSEAPKERVAAKRRGAEADVKTDSGTDPTQTKFTISRDEIDKALENPQALLMQVRAYTYTKGGKPSGLKIASVESSSIFMKLGIRPGDILESINGNPLSLEQGANLFSVLRNEAQFTMNLIRRGKSQTFEYTVQ